VDSIRTIVNTLFSNNGSSDNMVQHLFRFKKKQTFLKIKKAEQ
jgi:hypothetical protein